MSGRRPRSESPAGRNDQNLHVRWHTTNSGAYREGYARLDGGTCDGRLPPARTPCAMVEGPPQLAAFANRRGNSVAGPCRLKLGISGMGETRAVPGGCMDIPTEARRILSEATMPVARQRASVRPPHGQLSALCGRRRGKTCQTRIPATIPFRMYLAADSKLEDATVRPIEGCCAGTQGNVVAPT